MSLEYRDVSSRHPVGGDTSPSVDSSDVYPQDCLYRDSCEVLLKSITLQSCALVLLLRLSTDTVAACQYCMEYTEKSVCEQCEAVLLTYRIESGEAKCPTTLKRFAALPHEQRASELHRILTEVPHAVLLTTIHLLRCSCYSVYKAFHFSKRFVRVVHHVLTSHRAWCESSATSLGGVFTNSPEERRECDTASLFRLQYANATAVWAPQRATFLREDGKVSLQPLASTIFPELRAFGAPVATHPLDQIQKGCVHMWFNECLPSTLIHLVQEHQAVEYAAQQVLSRYFTRWRTVRGMHMLTQLGRSALNFSETPSFLSHSLMEERAEISRIAADHSTSNQGAMTAAEVSDMMHTLTTSSMEVGQFKGGETVPLLPSEELLVWFRRWASWTQMYHSATLLTIQRQQNAVQRFVFRRWGKRYVSALRRQKRAMEGQLLKVVTAQKAKRTLSEAFTIWLRSSQLRQFTRNRRTRPLFRHWLLLSWAEEWKRSMPSRTLRSPPSPPTLSDLFLRWKLRYCEHRADAFRDRKLLTTALSTLVKKTNHRSRARVVSLVTSRSVLQFCVRTWFMKAKDRIRLRQWLSHTRERCAARTWKKWRHCLERHQHLNRIERAATQVSQRERLLQCWRTWVAHHHRRHEVRACDLIAHSSVCASVLFAWKREWVRRCEKRAGQQRVAEECHIRWMSRHYLTRWQTRLVAVREGIYQKKEADDLNMAAEAFGHSRAARCFYMWKTAFLIRKRRGERGAVRRIPRGSSDNEMTVIRLPYPVTPSERSVSLTDLRLLHRFVLEQRGKSRRFPTPVSRAPAAPYLPMRRSQAMDGDSCCESGLNISR